MRIYVGNLVNEVSGDDLRSEFSAYGEVASADVITDRYTGQSRGFGFVEMRDSDSAQKAIRELDGRDMKGRQIKVNEARPRTESRGFSGGGGGGGGGRGPRW